MKNLCILLLLVSSTCFSQILKQEIEDRMVVLTFDDATASHFSVVAPLLKEYGFNATFFVCEFPPNYVDSTKYMNWRQIKELDKMGFEIANHTRSHAGVAKLADKEIVDQLNYIEEKCDSLGVDKPVNFAYPGYSLSPNSLEVLESNGYAFARAGGSRPYNPLQDHPFLLPSWAPDAENKEQIIEAINQAKNGKITILTFHGVPDIEHPWVDTPIAIFKEYLDYLSTNHYKVISLRAIENYIDVEKAKELLKPDFSKELRN